MSERKPKTNAAWDALCAHTTTLFKTGKFSGRPEAFRAACQQYPSLAAEAIDPYGEFVIPRIAKRNPTDYEIGRRDADLEAAARATASRPAVQKPKESPIVKAAEKLASQHKAGAPNPLIAAAESRG